MDDNRVEGLGHEAAGRVEDAWGGLTGDAATQARGKIEQVKGAAQKLYGKARDQVGEAIGDALGARAQQAKAQLDETLDLITRKPLAAVGVAAFVGLTLGLMMSTGRTTKIVYVPR
jgi:uncharacterized protein YjbJ (UPF0337 family)